MGRRLSENEIGLEARTFISWKFDWNKGIIWNFASRHVCNSTKVCWPVVKIISTPPPFKMEFSAGIESIFPRSRARIIKSIVTYGANGISRAWLSFASRFTITGTLTRGQVSLRGTLARNIREGVDYGARPRTRKPRSRLRNPISIHPDIDPEMARSRSKA